MLSDYYIPLLVDCKFPNRLQPLSDTGALNGAAWGVKNSHNAEHRNGVSTTGRSP